MLKYMDNSLTYMSKLLPQDELIKCKQADVYKFSRDSRAPTCDNASSRTTKIVVVNEDCLKVAIHLANKDGGTHIGVLNMANEYNCGGGFNFCRGSQEEYIFRSKS